MGAFLTVVALFAFHCSLHRGKGPGFAASGIQRTAGLPFDDVEEKTGYSLKAFP
jgi:hypothetical protein